MRSLLSSKRTEKILTSLRVFDRIRQPVSGDWHPKRNKILGKDANDTAVLA